METNQAAPRSIPLGFRLLFLVIGLYLAVMLGRMLSEDSWWLRLLLTAFEAGMVGGLCDSIAIMMLFKRHAWIPKSGLIARNMESFSLEVAATVEHEMLSPESLRQHLSQGSGQRLKDKLLARLQGDPELEGRIKGAIAGFLAEKVGNPEFLKSFFKGMFPAEHPASMFVMALDWDELAPRVRGYLVQRGPELVALEGLLEKLDANHLDTWFSELVTMLIPPGTVQTLVAQELHRMGADGVAEMMERRAGRHLDHIRVNGVVFGSLIGLLLGSLREFGVG